MRPYSPEARATHTNPKRNRGLRRLGPATCTRGQVAAPRFRFGLVWKTPLALAVRHRKLPKSRKVI